MEYLTPFFNEFYSKININTLEAYFTIFMVIICPVTWNLVARYEFYTQYFTKKCNGNKVLAADIFAHVLIEMGVLRNYLMVRLVKHSLHMDFSDTMNSLCSSVSWFIFIFGLVLVSTSYMQLGIHGIYYADYFGILMKEPCRGFPYSFFENPLYIGSQALYFSIVLSHRSPTGAVIMVILSFMYWVAGVLENPMTPLIYSQGGNANVRKAAEQLMEEYSQEKREKERSKRERSSDSKNSKNSKKSK